MRLYIIYLMILYNIPYICNVYKISFYSLSLEILVSKRCTKLIHSIIDQHLLTTYCMPAIILGVEIAKTNRINIVRSLMC